MTLFHSIRGRLTLWYTALLAATIFGFGFLSYLFIRSTLSDNIDRSLYNEMRWVNEFIEPKAKKVRLKRSALLELQRLRQSATARAELENVLVDTSETDQIWNQIYQHTILSPRSQYIQILDRNGDLLYRSSSLGNLVLKYDDIPYGWVNIVTIKHEQGRELRLAISQNDYVKIFVAFPLEELNEALGGIFSIFRILAPIAILISMVGGWFLAHRSLRPVDVITQTARKISAQNLTQRLPPRAVDDELGRLTATFNDMIGRLQESFLQIQRFSAEASHELRTPLTIMRGEIEVALRRKRLPTPTRELLASVHDEVVRLSSIVESLMILIKSESGRLAFQIENVQLDDMLRGLSEDAHVLAARKRIKVVVGEMEPALVRGDATRLHQLFLNLVDNAIKYSPPMSTVTLSLRRLERNVDVYVQDNGIGILKKDQAKVFDRFYRVNADGSGSGLGLSIAKWIAEAHHGSIRVTSREKKGSTFVVTLPLAHSNV